MYSLGRFLALIGTVIGAVVALFFFTTIGLFVLGFIAVLMFFGALSLRHSKTEGQNNTFRVIRFRHMNIPTDVTQRAEKQKKHTQQNQTTSESLRAHETIDLDPEDYKTIDDGRPKQ